MTERQTDPMRILSVHPKYFSDDRLNGEHDFLHKLYDALGKGGALAEHGDYFRYNGRRGLLYIRHRMLVEEMIARGLTHTTLIDRRQIDADEWKPLETSAKEILADRDLVLEEGVEGRTPLPDEDDPAALTGENDLHSALIGVTEHDILIGLWKRYRYLVMERSYGRYRSLADPIQGKARGQVWMLFDLMMEEALAADPDDRGPRIAYETMWEQIEEQATEEDKEEFGKLLEALQPGEISLPMRRFLAGVASRCDHEELLKSQLFKGCIQEPGTEN